MCHAQKAEQAGREAGRSLRDQSPGAGTAPVGGLGTGWKQRSILSPSCGRCAEQPSARAGTTTKTLSEGWGGQPPSSKWAHCGFWGARAQKATWAPGILPEAVFRVWSGWIWPLYPLACVTDALYMLPTPIKIGLKYARWRKKVWSDNGIQSVRIIFSVSDLREPELLITLNVLFYLIPKWLFYEGFTFFFYLLYCKWGHRISERFFPKITFPRGVKRRQFIRSRMPPVGADWAATLF